MANIYADIYKNVPDLNKLADYLNVENFLSATRELVEINARYMGEVLDNQVELANFCVESGEKALEAVNDIKDYHDLAMKQKDMVEEFASKLTDITEKNIKLVQDTGKDIQTLLNRNLQAAQKQVNKPVKAAVQKKAA